jgi:hypothetical protein
MKLKLTAIMLAVAFTSLAKVQAQTTNSTKAVLFDGIVIGGYVDHGGYINCTGPAIKFIKKPVAIIIGLLPGLRIKKDKVAPGAPENSVLTPSLGFGLTAAVKHLAIQLPFYYNGKTSTKDGKWHPGVGLGYRF